MPRPAATPMPRIRSCGDAAVSVEFADTVDPVTNGLVLALDAALSAAPIPGVIETVPTYRSLLVHFDPVAADVDKLEARLMALALSVSPVAGRRRRWRVPVTYGGAFGVDLDELAADRGMTSEVFAELHYASIYRIYMIGFLPGFAYLGGLDPRLHVPRRLTPRPIIPAQSVSIGGAQTAIGSVEGPSGWSLIGRTPVRGFLRGRDPVFLFEPGDEIAFEPIPANQWDELDRRAAAGEPVAVLEGER